MTVYGNTVVAFIPIEIIICGYIYYSLADSVLYWCSRMRGDAMNIKLQEWKIEDAPDLAAAINNVKVLDNLRDGIPYPYTEKDATEFIAAMLSAKRDTQYAFAICYDDKVIGSIGVFRKDNVHRYTAEMGYYIAEPYWGKGIMTEAVRQMCAYVFENTDIVRIFAEPYARNNASCRVLEKAGFQFEGTLHQNAVKNGQSVDMRMYANIRDRKGSVFQDIKARITEPESGIGKRTDFTEVTRCPWAAGDDKMAKYHDEVWGKPEHDDQKLFAKLCLDLMQAGLMWRTILYKQDGFYKAFDDFHIETVAGYDEVKYEELMQDAGIVRNKLKIRAIINNAGRVMEIQKEFGSFDAYIWSFTKGEAIKNHWQDVKRIPASTPLSDSMSKDMKKRGFRFVGTTIVYAFLQAVGVVNDHLESCFRYNEVDRYDGQRS